MRKLTRKLKLSIKFSNIQRYLISSVIKPKGKSQNGCFKKTKHAKFSGKWTYLTLTHVRLVSGGKKFSFLRKFGVLCFLETLVLRFVLSPYYLRFINTWKKYDFEILIFNRLIKIVHVVWSIISHFASKNNKYNKINHRVQWRKPFTLVILFHEPNLGCNTSQEMQKGLSDREGIVINPLPGPKWGPR